MQQHYFLNKKTTYSTISVVELLNCLYRLYINIDLW